MSWVEECLPILRCLIGDDDSPETYSDDRLEDILFSTAKIILLEVSFSNNYIVSIVNHTITPDPIEDQFFIPLVALKAATKVANSEYKAAAYSAGSVSDGPATINLGGMSIALKARMEALQKDYDKARMQYILGNAVGCQAVLSSCENIYRNCYSNGCFIEERYTNYCC